MLKNISLYDFGYNFLGPILSRYVSGVSEKLSQLPKNAKVYHLAREGYAIEKAFDRVNEDNIPCSYLNVSRVFLFKIMADLEASWPLSVKHGFSGTLAQFLHARFAFSQQQIDYIVSIEAQTQQVVLPDDYSKVCKILKSSQKKITEIVTPTRNVYLSYLESIGFTSKATTPVVLDVGYSGTIQKLLTLLVSKDVHGIYMITTKSGSFDIGTNKVHIHHVFKSNVKMGEGYTLLDRSMFLEALLTAPHGQFVDIIANENEESFHFCYGKRTYTQENYTDLDTVVCGGLACIENAHNNSIQFTISEIEALFTAHVTQRNLLPSATWPLFIFDDAISGEGNVHPLSFFGL